MSRSVSNQFLAEVFAAGSDNAFLVLLLIDHDSLASPIRLVNSGEDVISGGETYQWFPFRIQLPDETDTEPVARLEVDGVDRSIIEAVRSINSPAEVTISIVLSDDPDTVEVSFAPMELFDVTYDSLSVSGRLRVRALNREPYPAKVFSPTDFPGLF